MAVLKSDLEYLYYSIIECMVFGLSSERIVAGSW